MAGNPITSFSGFNLLFYNDHMRSEGFGRNPHEIFMVSQREELGLKPRNTTVWCLKFRNTFRHDRDVLWCLQELGLHRYGNMVTWPKPALHGELGFHFGNPTVWGTGVVCVWMNDDFYLLVIPMYIWMTKLSDRPLTLPATEKNDPTSDPSIYMICNVSYAKDFQTNSKYSKITLQV